MSGKVVGWAMEQVTGSPISKLVLVKLADNANEDGVCWPSVALMLRHTELSDRTVRDHVKKLEQNGHIKVEQRMTERGQVSNVYILNVPRDSAAPKPKHPLQVVQGVPCATRTHPLQVVQGAPAGGAVPIEEPSIEPSLNLDAPLGAPPLTGRAERLAMMFEPAVLSAWFGGSYFIEGPPLTLVLAKRVQCSWVRDRFGDRLRRTFGDHLVFDFARESIDEVADG